MGLPRPDAGTPVHDYLASRQSRLVILEWPWIYPQSDSDELKGVDDLGSRPDGRSQPRREEPERGKCIQPEHHYGYKHVCDFGRSA